MKAAAAVRNVAALCKSINYPSPASVPHSIVTGFRNIQALSLAIGYEPELNHTSPVDYVNEVRPFSFSVLFSFPLSFLVLCVPRWSNFLLCRWIPIIPWPIIIDETVYVFALFICLFVIHLREVVSASGNNVKSSLVLNSCHFIITLPHTLNMISFQPSYLYRTPWCLRKEISLALIW